MISEIYYYMFEGIGRCDEGKAQRTWIGLLSNTSMISEIYYYMFEGIGHCDEGKAQQT